MTIAITIKVNDGVVMATDSAATMFSPDGKDNYIYNNANKLFNLYKGLPIGIQTAGLGGIGQASIGTLVKDFRQKIMSETDSVRIDPDNYTIEEVASIFKNFIYDETYAEYFKSILKQDCPYLGFIIAGYSSTQSLPEVWKIPIIEGQCNNPILVQDQHFTGMCWDGEPEPVMRLMMGFGSNLPFILKDAGINDVKIAEIMELCKRDLDARFVTAPMPIQDVVELAAFLAETAVKWAKYRPGADSIGGPIDLAAITKYEGFKWIYRKHYFDKNLNP